jgi:hypothetical protein
MYFIKILAREFRNLQGLVMSVLPGMALRVIFWAYSWGFRWRRTWNTSFIFVV